MPESIWMNDAVPVVAARNQAVMHVSRYLSAILPIGCIAITGCDHEPSLVYVPAKPPEVTVEASVSAVDAVAGETLTLHARRFYRGEWEQVKRKSLPDGTCWMRRPPPEREDEAADNIHWTVDPGEQAKFNLDLRRDHTRTVTFSAPGQYRISGTSSVWCGSPVSVEPGAILVEIRE